MVYILCSKITVYTLTYTNIALSKSRLCYANTKEMKITLYLELWLLHIKAEEKTVAFMFFFSFYAVYMIIGEKENTEFVCGGGIRWAGKGGAEGQDGQF